MSDFRLRRSFEEFVFLRNAPLNTNVLFETNCKILLYLNFTFPVSSLPPSLSIAFELLDPLYSDGIPHDLRSGLVRFIQTGERAAALRNRSKTRCNDSPLMHEHTQITSNTMACDCVVEARSNENVKGATKNRPNAYPTDASCKIHKKYENPRVNEYLRSNSVEDEVVEDMSAHAAAEHSNRWKTYTSKKVAENNLAVESNESDDAARGELATLASAAAPASDSAMDPPSFVSGASKCTPLNSKTTFRKRKWTTDTTIPITSDTTQSVALSAMRFPAFATTTTSLQTIDRRPTNASPTTPIVWL